MSRTPFLAGTAVYKTASGNRPVSLPLYKKEGGITEQATAVAEAI